MAAEATTNGGLPTLPPPYGSPAPSPGTSGAPDAAPVPPSYFAATRTIMSRGIARSFLLVTPTPMPPGAAPLVLAFHGDGGTPEGLRAALPLEEAAKGEAVVVYPAAPPPERTFRYWSDEGRAAEATLVTDVVALLERELGIDARRVFLAGFSGGATLANALACVLGSSVVRSVGVHSGTLYSVSDSAGPVSCVLPGSIIVWGTADATFGTTFPEGERTRDRYRDSLSCAATTKPASTSPCVGYDGCRAPLTWCPIEGQGHAIWPAAAAAMWAHFSAMR